VSGGIGTLLLAAAALLAVVALIHGGAALLRRSGFTRSGGPERIVSVRESVALDAKRRLHLVQCGARQVVLLTGGPRDLVVGWIEPPG
jgi:flagellar protein FliO/FliZ